MPADTDFSGDESSPEEKDNSPHDADDVESDEPRDATDVEAPAEPAKAPTERGGRFSWARLLAHWVLPALALVLAVAAGYFKWLDGSAQESCTAATQSVRAATDSTVALLSYRPDSVDRDLAAATDRLTGGFRDQYKQLVGDVVAPGAKQQHITAVATVPAAASVSATESHAVVLVFVDQTTTIGNDAPTQTTSSVRVTLDNVRDRWLISQFDPV